MTARKPKAPAERMPHYCLSVYDYTGNLVCDVMMAHGIAYDRAEAWAYRILQNRPEATSVTIFDEVTDTAVVTIARIIPEPDPTPIHAPAC